MPDTLDLLVQLVTWPVAIIILLNGLDDLVVDVLYLGKGLGRKRRRRLTVEELRSGPEQRAAILVAAWHEDAVIQQMLENTLATQDYPRDRYDIFVGTYANDPATRTRVDRVAAEHPNVHRVQVPHDGPTCKADCLNWVYAGLVAAEAARGERYDFLVMHDAEDVIHPFALRLYDRLIPQYEFVQTPVLPLSLGPRKLVAGTYVDEFTEHHLKDMLVRAEIGGLIPSAGVGSGFEREAFEQIAHANREEAFDPDSLTEDYEIGVKFRLADKRTWFGLASTQQVMERPPGLFRKAPTEVEFEEYIATREYFPSTFRAAVRQRSRWILGIDFQTWEKVGWAGPLAVRWCLWRDRKSLLTHAASFGGYMVVLYCLLRWLGSALELSPWSFNAVFVPGSGLHTLVLVNLLFVGWRVGMKIILTHRVYRWSVALMSVPRFFVDNAINFFALVKATHQWFDFKRKGKPLAWAHTRHVFPVAPPLVEAQTAALPEGALPEGAAACSEA